MPWLAHAQTLQTIYSFTGGADGALPNGALLYHHGALFGAALGGGPADQGTIFKIDLARHSVSVLHAFAGGADGSDPSGGLILRNNLLYGTAGGGGVFNCLGGGCGLVFSIDPATGAKSTVYAFAGGADGGFPLAGLISHGTTLYGTTYLFGGNPGYGTVFSLDPATGAESVLYRFGQRGGHSPKATLSEHGGSLFGTADAGGNAGCAQEGCGTVFKLNPATGTAHTVHVFGHHDDGQAPECGLLYQNGLFYGTTSAGGRFQSGTVFSLNPATGAERVLHAFTGRSDGAAPVAGLTAVNGLLYGVTSQGGTFNKNCQDAGEDNGCGTIFSINPATGKITTEYRFSGAADGAGPAGAIIAVGGTLYGTTSGGGAAESGTVFSFTP
jgi:uncharacterized repeat protein (TIGR03803 family)